MVIASVGRRGLKRTGIHGRVSKVSVSRAGVAACLLAANGLDVLHGRSARVLVPVHGVDGCLTVGLAVAARDARVEVVVARVAAPQRRHAKQRYRKEIPGKAEVLRGGVHGR